MKEIICQACGKRMPAKFNVCPSCGHKRVGVVTINKILYTIFFLVVIGVAAYFYFSPARGPEPIQPVDYAVSPFPYKIVKEWHPNNEASKIGLSLVVNASITKELAHLLVDHLNIKYQRYTNVFISVFDNEEVAENYTNTKYSQEKINKHYLFQIIRNDHLDIDDVNWKREGFGIIAEE